MQVYKTFLKIAKAKLPSSIVYLCVFLVLTIIMSATAAEDTASKFEVSSVDICMIDKDQSTASQALCDYLTKYHTPVTLDSYDSETLQDNLYYQRISYVLMVPEGFEEELLAGQEPKVQTSKRADSASGYFVDQQIESYLRALSLYVTGGSSITDAVKQADDAFQSAPEITSLQFDKKSGDTDKGMYYFFQYLPYVLVMMLLEGLSPVLIAFRQKDLAARINCSALHTHAKNMQIGLGCITYSLGNWLLFAIISVILYQPSQIFSRNGLLCLLNSLVFTLIATALTLLVSSFSMNDNALNMVANVIGLGMSFLCGIFVPQWYLGDAVISASRFLPAYWYVRINNMLSGFSDEVLSMDTYRMCIGVEVLFLAAIFAVYLAINRQREKTSLA